MSRASASSIQAGRAHVTIGADVDPLLRGLATARRAMQKFGTELRNVGVSIAAIGTGLAAPLAAATTLFAKFGDSVAKSSRRTGLSVDATQQLGFAAEQSGTNLAELERGVVRLQRSIEEAALGNRLYADTLERIGLSYDELRQLAPDQQLARLADAVRDLPSGEQINIVQTLFGRGGAQLLPLLQAGADGIRALRAEYEAFGGQLTPQQAEDAEALADALNRLKRSAEGAALQIGAALADSLITVLNALSGGVKAITQFVRQNSALVVVAGAVAAALVGVGTALAGIGVAAIVIGALVGAIASPLGLVLTGIVALAAGVAAVITAFGAWDDVLRIVRGAIDGIAKSIVGDILGALNSVVVILSSGNVAEAFRALGDLIKLTLKLAAQQSLVFITVALDGIVSASAKAAVAIAGIIDQILQKLTLDVGQAFVAVNAAVQALLTGLAALPGVNNAAVQATIAQLKATSAQLLLSAAIQADAFGTTAAQAFTTAVDAAVKAATDSTAALRRAANVARDAALQDITRQITALSNRADDLRKETDAAVKAAGQSGVGGVGSAAATAPGPGSFGSFDPGFLRQIFAVGTDAQNQTRIISIMQQILGVTREIAGKPGEVLR